jgi:hypothetical protein
MLSGKNSYTIPSGMTLSYGKPIIYNAHQTATSALQKTFSNYRIYSDTTHDLPTKYKSHQ